MDRRQKKTREAIFNALCDLLSKKQYNSITVGEIIERADVGRATFYSHFETKDTLLSELCRELFCHIFDMSEGGEHTHRHIFECDAQSPVFLHLLRHLEKNDHNILRLLSGENNEVFLRYFKENLGELIKKSLPTSERAASLSVPESFLVNHLASAFVEAVRWWVVNKMSVPAEVIAEYFSAVTLGSWLP